MTNLKATVFIAVMMASTQFLTSAQETSAKAVFVSYPTANIRQQPSTSSGIAGKAYYNDCFEMIGQDGDWFKIRNNICQDRIDAPDIVAAIRYRMEQGVSSAIC